MHSVSACLSTSTDVDDATIPLVKHDQSCQATDESTGEPCGETEGLRILDEFRKLYESRIEKIDRESDSESDRISVSRVSYRNGIRFMHAALLDSFFASFVRYFKCSKQLQLKNINSCLHLMSSIIKTLLCR